MPARDPDAGARQAAAEAINTQMAKECYQIPIGWTLWGTPHVAELQGLGETTMPDGSRPATAPASAASSGSTRSGSTKAEQQRSGVGRPTTDPPRTHFSSTKFHEVDVRYFLQRLLQFFIVFFLVTFSVMVFMRLGMNKPGDPALTMLGGTVRVEDAEKINEQYHLNGNIFAQYWYWLKGMLSGDFGISVQQNTTVAKYLSGRVLGDDLPRLLRDSLGS